MAENDGTNSLAQEESVNHDQSSSVRSSSAVQRSGRSTSQDHDDPLSPPAVHGSTPLSQIGAHSCTPVNDMYLGQGEFEPTQAYDANESLFFPLHKSVKLNPFNNQFSRIAMISLRRLCVKHHFGLKSAILFFTVALFFYRETSHYFANIILFIANF